MLKFLFYHGRSVIKLLLSMVKNKLITLLRTFSKEEMKEFEKFISSPYFSRGRNLKPLYSVIKKYHPDFSSPHFTKEKIFRKLYPGKKFDGKKTTHALQVLVSELQTKAETFLMVNHFLRGNAFKEACLLSELRQRGLNESFASAYDKISNSIKNDRSGQSYFLKKHLVEFEKEVSSAEFKNKDILKYLDLQSKSEDSLIIYFISELIRHVQSRKMNYHKEAERSKLSSVFYQCFNFDKFVELIIHESGNENDLLKILFYSAKLDTDFNDLESYEKLKFELDLNKEKMDVGFYYSAVSRLMNFTLFQKVKDVDFFKRDYVEFYESLIRKAITEKNSVILKNFAFNIRAIFNASRIYPRLNLTDRLETLFKENSKYLLPEIKKDAMNLIQATIEFARENFDICLRTLNTIDITVPMVVKEIKIMKLKALYELRYFESLLAEVDSYRHFLLKTNEILEEYKKNDKEFLKLIVKLARLSESKKPDSLILFKKEVENLGFTTYHTSWILEKIDKLT
ncbi:MAG: hypothetical protein K8I03_09265 [Ignavibacteria bacterium]|nr:hypothetical protein [Ignavibacteria bacterium]